MHHNSGVIYFFIIILLCFKISYGQSGDNSKIGAAIIIKSNPSNASILVDSVFAGNTPCAIKVSNTKHHIIKILKNGYLPFRSDVFVKDKDTVSIEAVLEQFSGSLSVVTGNDNSTIKIDGKLVGEGKIDSFMIPVGAYEINIYNPDTKKEVSSLFKVESNGRLFIKPEYNVVPTTRLLFSILFPGYAQIDDNSYIKGIFFTLASIGSVAFLISEYSVFNDSEADYKQALDNYDKAGSDFEVESAKNTLNRKQSDYNTMRTRYRLSIGSVAFVWLSNAVDVAFNHLLTNRIRVYSSADFNGQYKLSHSDYNINFALGF